MIINIPPITVPIELADYAPELAGQRVYVWVNLPRDKYNAFMALGAEAVEEPDDGPNVESIGQRAVESLVEIWSQNADPKTHWTAESIEKVIAHKDTDPMFYPWLLRQTLNRLIAHRGETKKKSPTRPTT